MFCYRVLALLGGAAFGACAFADFVAYREIFCHSGTDAPSYSNGAPTNGSSPHIAWDLHRAGVTSPILGGSGSAAVNTVASGAGIPANLPAINAGPQQSAQTERGFAVIAGANASTQPYIPNGQAYVLHTGEFAIAAPLVESISWFQGNHLATDVWRVALHVDADGNPATLGQWYVSDTSFTNVSVTSGGAFATEGQARQLAFSGALWRPLTFDHRLGQSSGSLALGAATTLPNQMITRFGMFTDSKNNNMRFDTFEIHAVPEPATLAGLALGALAVFRRRTRTTDRT